MGTVHWVLTDPGRRALIIDKGHPNGDLSTLPTSFKASLTSVQPCAQVLILGLPQVNMELRDGEAVYSTHDLKDQCYGMSYISGFKI